MPKRDLELAAMPYYGGKARTELRKWLLPLVPYDAKGLYVEPFAGMLGVLLGRQRTKTEVVNDLDSNIYTWWCAVRDYPDELMHKIHHTPNCRQTYNRAFYDLKKKTYKDNPIMWAWCTYVVLAYNVAHGTGTGGWAVNYQGNGVRGKKNFVEVIKPLAERLRLVQVECKDALYIIDRVKNIERSVIYCDPPYHTADTKSYDFREGTIDFELMTELLLACKGQVAISGYREEWDHLGWQRHEWDTRAYPIAEKDKEKDLDWERTEVLWTNYKVGDNQMDLFVS